MEKISLKIFFITVLISFSCAAVFAQEGGGSENVNQTDDSATPAGSISTEITPKDASPEPSQSKETPKTTSKPPARPASATSLQLKVTFDPNDGTVDPTSITVTVGSDNNRLPIPTKLNFKFLGWYTGKNGTGEEFDPNTAPKNVTVYAKWVEEITVTFDPDGGTVNTPSKKFPRGHIIGGNDLPRPTKPDFQFEGWFKGKNGSGEKFDEGYKITENITVYANWNNVTVKFYSYADGSSIATKEFPRDHTVLENDIPTPTQKQHSLFLGWFKNNGEEIKKGSKITSDMNLYAKWIDYRILIIFAAVTIVLLLLITFVISLAVKIEKLKDLSKDLSDKIKDNSKTIKDSADKYKNDIDNINQRLQKIDVKPDSQSSNDRQGTNSLQFRELEGRVNNLENDIRDLKKNEKTANDMASGRLDVKDVFNAWASNPQSPLPKSFYFIAGDMNIRTIREIKESPTETLWISNREGGKKYLFPNPRLFDQMTNILELYEMDQRLLRKKGDNKIKILFPCEISPSGFVEFPGKLELLP
ncbi:MAG: InlB B-repeat-containing protein [Spirochaetaceae bacterium]|jgi:uncharacterized repeat protein (TIGR02543 family)|nr:InlB B-repeat-containing protein [Spirochaetaceae bacterium]